MQSQKWSVDGVPVVGYRWRPQPGPARGAVLMTHGFGEYAGRYVHRYHGLIPALLDNGFEVYAYDQRGHGQSGGKPAVADLRVLVEDHLKARDALRAQPLPVFAFGHSMGGLVTAASAARDPRGLSGLILSSPALLVGEDEPAALKTFAPVLARIAPGLGVTRLPTAGLSRLKDEVSAYEEDTGIFHGKVPALTASSMLRLSESLWRQYEKLTLPVLVFHGTQDRLADFRGSQRFIGAVGSPDKTFVEFSGGYHELLNDQPRAEVRELILSWLKERAT